MPCHLHYFEIFLPLVVLVVIVTVFIIIFFTSFHFHHLHQHYHLHHQRHHHHFFFLYRPPYPIPVSDNDLTILSSRSANPCPQILPAFFGNRHKTIVMSAHCLPIWSKINQQFSSLQMVRVGINEIALIYIYAVYFPKKENK